MFEHRLPGHHHGHVAAVILGHLLYVLYVAAGVWASVDRPWPGVESVAQAGGLRAVGTGLVAGRVVDAVTGEAVPGARVAATGLEPRLTDADGRFVYFDVPAGSLRILAEHPAYLRGEFGRRWTGALHTVAPVGAADPGIQRVTLAEGERRGDVVIRLWKLSAITGRVIDEAGDPAVDVLVQAWPRVVAGGRPWFNHVLAASARTDDRGIYRLAGLPPGTYVVVVPALSLTMPAQAFESSAGADVEGRSLNLYRALHTLQPAQPGRALPAAGRGNALSGGEWLLGLVGQPSATAPDAPPLTYPTTFHPGVLALDEAAAMDVAPGVEIDRGDLRLAPVAARRVSGEVSGPAGPAAGVTVTLVLANQGPGAETAMAVTNAAGRFVFLAVPPGAYRLEALEIPHAPGASRQSPSGTADHAGVVTFAASPWADTDTLWASESLAVGDADVTDVAVVLRRGARISGVVRFEGAAPRPGPDSLRQILALDRPDGRPRAIGVEPEIGVDARGAFRSIGLPPGRYLIRAPRPPAGWTLQSAMYGGRDVSIAPLELDAGPVDGVVVTFTDRPSEIQGVVRTPAGSADGAAMVVAFPIDPALRVDYGAWPRAPVYARADEAGRFTLRALPAGEYWLAAIDEGAMGGWGSPEWFEALSRAAVRIAVRDGERRALDLTRREGR